MLTKLPYGLRNGQLVSIEDVAQGLECNCQCPSCGSRLIAKKGNTRDHHFAHYKSIECKTGLETALHLAAKEVISEVKKFTIPALYSMIEEFSFATCQLSPKMILNIDEVKLEHKFGDIVPDIIATIKGKELLIEIAVTHFIDSEKERKIKALGLSTVEVDLSGLKDGFSKDDLNRLVLFEDSNKKWIYNARETELERQYIERYFREIEKKKLFVKMQKERADLMEKRQKERIYLVRKQGYDIISINEDGEVHCPKVIKEKSLNFRRNFVITLLQSGKKWNGIIYGKGSNSRYIYIGDEKIEIFPPDDNFTLNEEQISERKKLFGQLSTLKEQSLTDQEKCEACPFFGEYLDNYKGSFYCRYRKESKINS